MKRTLIAAVAAFGILFGANTATAQVEEGNFLIDPYVGAPTFNIWWKSVEDVTDADFSTVGPPISFGGRFEYMVADNFGLGVDGNYAITGFQDTRVNFDDTLSTEQNFKYTANRLRIMLRLNYHFVQTENLDVYAGFGAGYRNVKRTVYWNDSEDPESTYAITGFNIPVAFRIALGGRYYFNDFIGLNFELGAWGGSIIQGGLAIKV